MNDTEILNGLIELIDRRGWSGLILAAEDVLRTKMLVNNRREIRIALEAIVQQTKEMIR